MKIIFTSIIHLYRWCIAPLIGPCCRFYPTCSEYALQAFDKYPIHRALWLTVKRICRCNGRCEGGVDLLPEKDES